MSIHNDPRVSGNISSGGAPEGPTKVTTANIGGQQRKVEIKEPKLGLLGRFKNFLGLGRNTSTKQRSVSFTQTETSNNKLSAESSEARANKFVSILQLSNTSTEKLLKELSSIKSKNLEEYKKIIDRMGTQLAGGLAKKLNEGSSKLNDNVLKNIESMLKVTKPELVAVGNDLAKASAPLMLSVYQAHAKMFADLDSNHPQLELIRQGCELLDHLHTRALAHDHGNTKIITPPSPKVLGSGCVNTVLLVQMEKDRGVSKVFKEIPQATDKVALDLCKRFGMDSASPRTLARNLGASVVCNLLGQNISSAKKVVVPSQAAVVDGKVGLVMEKAEGISGHTKGTGPVRLSLEDQQYVRDNLVDPSSGTITPRGQQVLAHCFRDSGYKNFKFEHGTLFADNVLVNQKGISFQHQEIRKQEMWLQINDCITGQVDRHRGNAMFRQDTNGEFTGVTGIDNDFCFGNMKVIPAAISDDRSKDRHPFLCLPPAIDIDMYNAIKTLDLAKMAKELQQCGLSNEEIHCTLMRCDQLQKHADMLAASGKVIQPDRWGDASWPPPPPEGGLDKQFGLTDTNCYTKFHDIGA